MNRLRGKLTTVARLLRVAWPAGFRPDVWAPAPLGQ
jgi:hypothetical protein